MADDSGPNLDETPAPTEAEVEKSRNEKEYARRGGVGLPALELTVFIFIRTLLQVNGQMEMRVPIEAVVASYAQGIFYLLILAMVSICTYLLWKVDPA